MSQNTRVHPQRALLKLLSVLFIITFTWFCAESRIGPAVPSTTPLSLGTLCSATVPGSSDPTQDEWPMFRGQLNHTGEAHTNHTGRASPFWSYPTLGYMVSSPAVADGRVFVGDQYGKFYCINALTGMQSWYYDTGNYVESSPAVAGDRVFVGSDGSYIYCLNATFGNRIWFYHTGGSVRSSPAVAGGRVYVGSNDYKVYCLNATTGESLWNFTTKNCVYSSPAVADGRLYVGSLDGRVYCLNAYTGQQHWNYSTANQVYSSPTVAGGRVYVGSNDYKVYCLNATTGGFLWSYTKGDGWSSPAVVGGRVYVGSGNGNIYCLNATTGGFLWSYATDGIIYLSSPTVASGCVYIGNQNHKVYCLNAITGKSLWNYTTGNWVDSSPAVANGRVYVSSADCNVYCLPTILDKTPPTYTSVTESADLLEFGGTETITITGVADLSGIQAALIKFGGTNHTMTDLGGGTWRYNTWVPNATDTFPYTIFIGDTVGFWNGTSGEITVQDTTPPTYSSVTESDPLLELGGTETITIYNVTDLSGIWRIWIEFEAMEHDMTDLGGGNWCCSTWVPGSTGNYSYSITIEDYEYNFNTIPGTLQVIDTTPPACTSVTESADPLELGRTEAITIAGVADLSGIQAALIEFGGTNHTMTNLTGSCWYYNNWSPSSTGTHSYIIYIQDTTGNWNETSGSIEVVAPAPPTYTLVTENTDPLTLGGTEIITITGVTDISGIQTVRIAFEGENHTMTDLGGGTWVYNTWIPGSAGTYPYIIYIQDTIGNWNATSGSIEVKSTSSIPAFSWLFIILAFSIVASLVLLKKKFNQNIPRVF